MSKKIAINGFGRIGRAALRSIHQRQQAGETDLEVVAINDLTDVNMLAHLLRYDSVHRRFAGKVEIADGAIVVDGKTIHTSAERDPKNLPWAKLGVDVVLEATGAFRTHEKAMWHVEAGAKRVLLSAPASGPKGADATICYGINNSMLKPGDKVISTASCTTNCLAPVAKVLEDQFGIEKALVTTVHSYTNDQRILDLPHSDMRRARAAAINIIPTTTGAAKALTLVLPEMDGKFDGMAIRVPTPDVSLIDLVVHTKKNTDEAAVNAALQAAAEGPLKGVLGYSDEPLVSGDYIGTHESSIVDALSTKVIGGNMVKILSWYDNEWGFTQRAVDLLELASSGATS